MLRRLLGFTLFELMVTLAIMAIVATLAFPSYMDSVRKSRRADAQAKMREFEVFAARMFTVDSDYSCFEDGGDCDPPTGDDYYSYSVAMDGASLTYTLTATPQGTQEEDSCGTMTVTQTGAVTAEGSGCWQGQSSGS